MGLTDEENAVEDFGVCFENAVHNAVGNGAGHSLTSKGHKKVCPQSPSFVVTSQCQEKEVEGMVVIIGEGVREYYHDHPEQRLEFYMRIRDLCKVAWGALKRHPDVEQLVEISLHTLCVRG